MGGRAFKVAAKILDAGADHDARKRFLREAQLALGVKHPNLVETYDVGEDPDSGLCYILMEYVSGGTLADYLKANGALAIEDAVAVVGAIAGVLELGCQKGIVHRDIKPANIMFDAEGTPKLAALPQQPPPVGRSPRTRPPPVGRSPRTRPPPVGRSPRTRPPPVGRSPRDRRIRPLAVSRHGSYPPSSSPRSPARSSFLLRRKAT